MPLTKEERIEMLAKAREKKKQLAEQRKSAVIDEVVKEEPKEGKKKKPEKKPKKTLDLTSMDDEKTQKKVDEPDDMVEFKNEIIRIKAPRKKTIIKRVIEVEEPSSEEEIQEEIVKVPRNKAKQEKNQITESRANAQGTQTSETIRNKRLFYDIFPNN